MEREKRVRGLGCAGGWPCLGRLGEGSAVCPPASVPAGSRWPRGAAGAALPPGTPLAGGKRLLLPISSCSRFISLTHLLWPLPGGDAAPRSLAGGLVAVGRDEGRTGEVLQVFLSSARGRQLGQQTAIIHCPFSTVSAAVRGVCLLA